MLKLNNIADKGSIKKPKRVGRGIGSGKGKLLEQDIKARSLGLVYLSKDLKEDKCPFIEDFKEGFKNPFRKEFSIINFGDIDKAINSKKLHPGKEISQVELIKAGLIRKKYRS